MRTRRAAWAAAVVVLILVAAGSGCARKKPPVARPMPPPETQTAVPETPPAPGPETVGEAAVVVPEAVPEDTMTSRSLDELNRDSPLKPVFFAYDSVEIGTEGQAVLNGNAAVLKKYPTWVITIEGHCDERGTAEYNLALGERRAVAARSYLVSLGISGDRLRSVSYGKEFPFDPAHTEEAYARNRRAHFVITAK